MPNYGTQTSPLNSFSNTAGETGNKTKNKDLPQWLQDLGMSGDAYAGGMLKPQLRYGFWYKNGKINFADGTSYEAKKVKGEDGKITYNYAGPNGQPQVYDPTDEQDTYNKEYKKATNNHGFLDKLGTTADFMHDHVRSVLKGGYDAVRGKGSIFGGTPIGTKLSNAVTGRHDAPITDQYGGPTDQEYADYVGANGKNSLGYAPELHEVGSAIASYYAGQGIAHGLGEAAQGLGASGSTLGNVAGSALQLAANNPKVVTGVLNAAASSAEPDAVMPAGSGGTGSGAGTGGSGTGTGTDVLPTSQLNRVRTAGPTNYLRYGMGPEHSFFAPGPTGGPTAPTQGDTPSPPVGVAPPTRIPDNLQSILERYMVKRAQGGRMPRTSPGPRRAAAGGPLSYVARGTGAGGREDNIDAKLSEGEYVIDAETVALLGDGNNEAGAKKLDSMRANIRSHKGGALSKGKISPDAHASPLQYLAEGGKVSTLRLLTSLIEGDRVRVANKRMHGAGLRGRVHSTTPERSGFVVVKMDDGSTRSYHDSDLKKTEYAEGGKVGVLRSLFRPRADPNAKLRKINSMLERALHRDPPTPPSRATEEELKQDVEKLRREVGAQGGDTRPLNRAKGGKTLRRIK